jgi:hypothetical protein
MDVNAMRRRYTNLLREERGSISVTWLAMTLVVIALILVLWQALFNPTIHGPLKGSVQGAITRYAQSFEGGVRTNGPQARRLREDYPEWATVSNDARELDEQRLEAENGQRAFADPGAIDEANVGKEYFEQNDQRAFADPGAIDEANVARQFFEQNRQRALADPGAIDEANVARAYFEQNQQRALDDPGAIDEANVAREYFEQNDQRALGDPGAIDEANVARQYFEQNDQRALDDPGAIDAANEARTYFEQNQQQGLNDPGAIDQNNTDRTFVEQNEQRALDDPGAIDEANADRSFFAQNQQRGLGDPGRVDGQLVALGTGNNLIVRQVSDRVLGTRVFLDLTNGAYMQVNTLNGQRIFVAAAPGVFGRVLPNDFVRFTDPARGLVLTLDPFTGTGTLTDANGQQRPITLQEARELGLIQAEFGSLYGLSPAAGWSLWGVTLGLPRLVW